MIAFAGLQNVYEIILFFIQNILPFLNDFNPPDYS